MYWVQTYKQLLALDARPDGGLDAIARQRFIVRGGIVGRVDSAESRHESFLCELGCLVLLPRRAVDQQRTRIRGGCSSSHGHLQRVKLAEDGRNETPRTAAAPAPGHHEPKLARGTMISPGPSMPGRAISPVRLHEQSRQPRTGPPQGTGAFAAWVALQLSWQPPKRRPLGPKDG
jgi:hypothetical protein